MTRVQAVEAFSHYGASEEGTCHRVCGGRGGAQPALAQVGSAGSEESGIAIDQKTDNWWRMVRDLLGPRNALPASNEMRNSAIKVFAVRVLSAGLLFVSQILLARWMGAADYGIYVSLWTAVLVAGGLSHLGFNMTMMRLVPEYLADGSGDMLRGLVRGGRLFAFAMGVLVATAGAVAIWMAGSSIQPELRPPILLMLACLPLYALTDVQDGLGRGQRWIFAGLVPPYIMRPLLILAAVAVLHVAKVPASATLAMSAALAATGITALVQLVLIERRLAGLFPRGERAYAFRKWMRISLPLLAVGGCELVLQNTDVLMLNLFLPPAEIGAYYAAAKTTTLALFVHYAVGSAYAGRIATAGALGDRKGLQRLVRDAVRWTFWPTLGIIVLVLAAGIPLLSMFGPGFADAYPIMIVLSVGMLARAAMGPSETVLNMLGHQRACAAAFGVAAVVCIFLNAFLIPFFGAIGAGLATTTAFSTAAVLNWMHARRLLDLDVFVFAGIRNRSGG